jgi:signal transduction histidine kinase
VRLDWRDDGLDIEITDDGGPSVERTAGRGLIGMRERVASVGGRLAAGPRHDGFAVTAHLPGAGDQAGPVP